MTSSIRHRGRKEKADAERRDLLGMAIHRLDQQRPMGPRQALQASRRLCGPRVTCQGFLPPRSITSRESTEASQASPASSSGVSAIAKRPGRRREPPGAHRCQYSLQESVGREFSEDRACVVASRRTLSQVPGEQLRIAMMKDPQVRGPDRLAPPDHLRLGALPRPLRTGAPRRGRTSGNSRSLREIVGQIEDPTGDEACRHVPPQGRDRPRGECDPLEWREVRQVRRRKVRVEPTPAERCRGSLKLLNPSAETRDVTSKQSATNLGIGPAEGAQSRIRPTARPNRATPA